MDRIEEIKVKEMPAKGLEEFPRIIHLRSFMEEGDYFLLSSAPSIYYFTGFKAGENTGIVLIPHEGRSIVVSDKRYETQIENEVDAELFDILMMEPAKGHLDYLDALKEKISLAGVRLHTERDSFLVKQFFKIKEFWPDVEIIFPPRLTLDFALSVRAIKDDGEISLIKRAIGITEKVLVETLPYVKVGVSENDIAAEISYRQKKTGAERDGFSLQILAGDHAALPHGVASERKIKKSDILQFDIGCVYEGYHSDISRVVMVGVKPTEKQIEIYRIVREIQEDMISRIKPGVMLNELYWLHCNLLKNYGYESKHGLGHGVGLEIHELPGVSVSESRAELNQVFTVEPGIYIPGWGGVRIEDVVLATEDGCKVLTKFPKDLTVLDI